MNKILYCPSCNAKLQELGKNVDKDWETEIKCPKCGNIILIRAEIQFNYYIKQVKEK